jgi:hypothetical protein
LGKGVVEEIFELGNGAEIDNVGGRSIMSVDAPKDGGEEAEVAPVRNFQERGSPSILAGVGTILYAGREMRGEPTRYEGRT